MSHYEERLERDLQGLQDRIRAMSEKVQSGLSNAVIALQKGDHQLAAETILALGSLLTWPKNDEKLYRGTCARQKPCINPPGGA